MNIQQLKKEVTEIIIKKLEGGVIPWNRPWKDTAPPLAMNWTTKQYYKGINQFLLEPGQYATFLQIKKAGGRIIKGAVAQSVYFSKPLTIEDRNENDEIIEKEIYMFKEYKVFNIETQTNLKPHQFARLRDFERIEACENILEAYTDKPVIKEIRNQACYVPVLDIVKMPKREAFKSAEQYYSTLFHELVHSTAHNKRLNREMNTNFGSKAYAKEELIAELGASMLCNLCHIDNKTIDNSASYIKSWLKNLKDDVNLIYEASKFASKAVSYMTNQTEEQEKAS